MKNCRPLKSVGEMWHAEGMDGKGWQRVQKRFHGNIEQHLKMLRP